MMRRLLPILLLSSAAFAADLIPYGPIALPTGKQEIVVADRTVTLTIDALAHTPDAPTRVHLASDLGLARTDPARAALVKLLQDPDAVVRAQAVRSLGSGSEVSALANDASPQVRREVALVTTDDAVLIKALADADPAVRNAGLGRSISDKTDAALAAALGGLSAADQMIACITLGGRKAIAAAGAIESLLQTPGPLPRVEAINALAAMQKIPLVQLGPLMADAHPAVRQAAVAALSSLPPGERFAPATAALADADIGVRTAAVTVLADVGTAASIGPVLAQLSAGDEDLHAAARAAAVAIVARDSDAAPVLDAAAAALLPSPNAGLRADASFFLGALRSKTQLARHAALLDGADWAVVLQASISLGQIADPSAAAALAAAAKRAAGIGDPNYSTWVNAATFDQATSRNTAGEQAVLSCVVLRYAPVIDAVKPILLKKTAPANIRDAAVWAIGVLQPPETAEPVLRALIGRLHDREESQDVVAEAIKAVGNGHVTPLEPDIAALRDGGEWPTCGWASVVLDYLHGTHTPLTAPSSVLAPSTTIRDLTPAAR